MKKKRLISLLLAAFITVMPLSFSFAAPTPEPTADNTTSTVTSPDGTTRTVTSDGNDVKSTPKATESTDTSSDTETTSATKTPSDTSSDTSSTSDTTLQSDTDTTSQNANSLPDGVTMEDPSLTPPNVQYAQSALLMDMASGRVLYSKNLDERVYPASTTKIMTCILALESGIMDSENPIVTVSDQAAAQPKVHLGMVAGERFYLKDLLYSLMLESHNDSGVAIAEAVAGSVEKFANLMNQKARTIGCYSTYFITPNGLDAADSNGIHHTTAEDLARIMRAGLQNARFRKVIGTVGYTIPATNLSAARPMHTHMPLMAKESDLYYEGCIGGKTGFANEAEHTLVVAAERNGRTYIAVTMRAVDLGINCTDSTALFDYAFNNFDTIDVNGTKMTVPKGVTVNDLTTEQVDRNGKTLNRYYYNGQYVGYVTAADPTPTPTEAPQTVQETTEDTAVQDTGSQTETAQDEQPETKGLSKTSKILLGVMAGMGVLLIILLILLRRKNY